MVPAVGSVTKEENDAVQDRNADKETVEEDEKAEEEENKMECDDADDINRDAEIVPRAAAMDVDESDTFAHQEQEEVKYKLHHI